MNMLEHQFGTTEPRAFDPRVVCTHPYTTAVQDSGDGILVRCKVCGAGRRNGVWDTYRASSDVERSLIQTKATQSYIDEVTGKLPVTPSAERLAFTAGLAVGAAIVCTAVAVAMILRVS